MVVAMVPLLIAKGACAASRFDIGLVIAAGMTIGTMFTLFVTPAVYTYLARDHQKGKARGEPIIVHAASPTDRAEPPVETLVEADEEAKAGMLFPGEPEPTPEASPAVSEPPLFAPVVVTMDQHGPERRPSKKERRRRRLPTAAE